MNICVTKADMANNPTNPVEPALERATGHKWLVSAHCAERRVEVNEDGDILFKTAIIDIPEEATVYIVAAAAGDIISPIEFEIGEAYVM